MNAVNTGKTFAGMTVQKSSNLKVIEPLSCVESGCTIHEWNFLYVMLFYNNVDTFLNSWVLRTGWVILRTWESLIGIFLSSPRSSSKDDASNPDAFLDSNSVISKFERNAQRSRRFAKLLACYQFMQYYLRLFRPANLLFLKLLMLTVWIRRDNCWIIGPIIRFFTKWTTWQGDKKSKVTFFFKFGVTHYLNTFLKENFCSILWAFHISYIFASKIGKVEQCRGTTSLQLTQKVSFMLLSECRIWMNMMSSIIGPEYTHTGYITHYLPIALEVIWPSAHRPSSERDSWPSQHIQRESIIKTGKGWAGEIFNPKTWAIERMSSCGFTIFLELEMPKIPIIFNQKGSVSTDLVFLYNLVCMTFFCKSNEHATTVGKNFTRFEAICILDKLSKANKVNLFSKNMTVACIQLASLSWSTEIVHRRQKLHIIYQFYCNNHTIVMQIFNLFACLCLFVLNRISGEWGNKYIFPIRFNLLFLTNR